LKCDERLEILVRGKVEPAVCGKYCPHKGDQPLGKGELQRLISLPSQHSTPPTNYDIAASGLTKLQKTSDGTYERVAGKKIEGFD
jgi:hypothetical protein